MRSILGRAAALVLLAAVGIAGHAAVAAAEPADLPSRITLRAGNAPVVVIDGKVYADLQNQHPATEFDVVRVVTGTQLRDRDSGQALCPDAGATDGGGQLRLCPVGDANTVWDIRSAAVQRYGDSDAQGIALRLEGAPQFAGRAVIEDYSLAPKAIVLRGPAMPGQVFEVLPVD